MLCFGIDVQAALPIAEASSIAPQPSSGVEAVNILRFGLPFASFPVARAARQRTSCIL